jgi:ArsR family transcriptional regulator
MRNIVKVFKALSDETRLRILNVLLEREWCVCEVMQALEISQTRASRNLSVLYDAGLLKMHRDGCWVLYSVDEDTLNGYTEDVISAVKKAMSKNKMSSSDRARLKNANRVGVRCGMEAVA